MTLIDTVYLMFAVLGGAVSLLVVTVITRADEMAQRWDVSGVRLFWSAFSLVTGLSIPLGLLFFFAGEAERAEFVSTLTAGLIFVFAMTMAWFAWSLVNLIIGTMIEPHEPTQSEYVRERLLERKNRRHK